MEIKMSSIVKAISFAAITTSATIAGDFHFGAHAAVNYSTAWGTDVENALDDKQFKTPWGVGFNAGFATKTAINEKFSFAPELDVALRRSSDDDITLSEWAIEIPLLFRFSPIPEIYFEFGPTAAFNLQTNLEQNDFEYEVEESLFEAGLCVGFGISNTISQNLDLGFRLGFGLNSFTDKIVILSQKNKMTMKNIQMSFGATYWIL